MGNCAWRARAAPRRCGASCVAALGELLDDLGAEGRQVVGVAAGHEALVDDDLLVDPVGARVAQVLLQRGPRGHGAAADDAGLDEDPRGVADRADRLPGLEEGAHEGHRVGVHAQEVGVGDAAGRHEPVVVVGVGIGHRLVGREGVALVEVVEALELALLQRDRGRPPPRRRGRPSAARSAPPAPRRRWRGRRCACRPACPCPVLLRSLVLTRYHVRHGSNGRSRATPCRGARTRARARRPTRRRHPKQRSVRCSARSRPEVTPPAVTMSPSSTTRARTTVARRGLEVGDRAVVGDRVAALERGRRRRAAWRPVQTEATTAPRWWRSRMARGRAPSWACVHAPCSARSFQPPPGTSEQVDLVGQRAVGGDDACRARARTVAEPSRVTSAASRSSRSVGEAREHLPGRQRVELVEAVEEEDFASPWAQRGAFGRPARQWQECHCTIDFRHAPRDRPAPCPTSSRSTSRPRPRSSATSPSATPSQRAGRAPGAVPTTTGFSLHVRARPRRGRRGRHGARPRAAASAVAAAARGARRPAGRPRARRARGLDLHRRLRPRARRPARRPPGHDALGATPRGWPRATRRSRSIPSVLYVDEGDVLTSAGVAAGIDLCLHLVRRDHGAEVANAVARRIVVAPHRDGGQAQFVEAPLPARGRAGLAATCAWAARAPARAAHGRRDGAPRRAPASAPSPGASGPRRAPRRCSGCSASACCTRAACWRRPTSRSRTSPTQAGFGTRRLAALALPPRDRDDAARVSPQLQG